MSPKTKLQFVWLQPPKSTSSFASEAIAEKDREPGLVVAPDVQLVPFHTHVSGRYVELMSIPPKIVALVPSVAIENR